METNERYKEFLKDLISLLIDRLEKTKVDENMEEGSLNVGKNLSLYETLDLIKSQAFAFGIPLSDIGLENIDLERELVIKK